MKEEPAWISEKDGICLVHWPHVSTAHDLQTAPRARRMASIF